MGGFLQKLAALKEVLDELTWKKIAQLTVLLLILFIGWATYEERYRIYSYINLDRITAHTNFTKRLSSSVVAEIDSIIKQSDYITAITVISVDFQKNTRNTIYASSSIYELKEFYEKNKSITYPLFIDGDTNYNSKVIDLINGDFICFPYSESLTSRVIPDSNKYANIVCASGIPPYYGRFSGIVAIYLKGTPTPDQVDRARVITKHLAAEIYEKDFR